MVKIPKFYISHKTILINFTLHFLIMAYDEYIAERIRRSFKDKNIVHSEKKMMGGLCFMIDDKMACGTHSDKKLNMDLLMLRIGEDNVNNYIKHEHVLEMNFTGRPMKNFIFVKPEGFDLDQDLDMWLQLCIDFNPLAKKSKSKSKKK